MGELVSWLLNSVGQNDREALQSTDLTLTADWDIYLFKIIKEQTVQNLTFFISLRSYLMCLCKWELSGNRGQDLKYNFNFGLFFKWGQVK